MNEQRSYHFKPNPNLPTHYTPALRSHKNFSYGGGASQGPRHGQNFQQGYNPPWFQQQQQQGKNRNEYQSQKRTQSFEKKILQFMGDNKLLLNLHEQKFAKLETFKSNTQIFQENTNALLKNLETQVGQLALTLQNQTKDAFPSDTQKNPRDCMVVQLRSGKELSSSRAEKKERSEQEENKETGEGEKEIRKENRKNSSEWIVETENRVHTEQHKKTVNKNRKRRFKPTHLQFHSHKDFRRQRRRNNFLNSWRFSRR